MRLDRIFIERKLDDVLEDLHVYESEKQYRVSDSNGDFIFSAFEESYVCSRWCLGTYRGWVFHLLDKNNQEIFRVSRPFRCSSCCFPCCLQRATIHVNDELLGSVTQNWNLWRPSFTIRDAHGSPVLIVKGPISCCYFGSVNFRIISTDQQYGIGTISKKWLGFTNTFLGNSFTINCPIDLDVKIKAILIGACILIDFVYFEEQSKLRQLEP